MKKVQLGTIAALLFLSFSCNRESREDMTALPEQYNAQYYIDLAETMLLEDEKEIALHSKDRDTSNGSYQTEKSAGHGMIYVPAGSHNSLQAAIDAVGMGGTVILESGTHIEDNSVNITKRVTIKGQEGAILRFDTEPDLDDTPPARMDPGLYINGAIGVLIENIAFRSIDGLAGTAILCRNTNYVRIKGNSIEEHLFGVVQQHANNTRIYDNHMVGGGEWCILNVNGKNMRIYNNTLGPIFVGDRGGLIFNNLFDNGNAVGILFCTPRLEPGYLQLPDGTLASAERSATRWLALNNMAIDMVWAYLVIDGANNNILVNNNATGSLLADIEMAGPSERFGTSAPTSYRNLTISAAYPDMTIKVCGENNRAIGGTLIDTNVFPCD